MSRSVWSAWSLLPLLYAPGKGKAPASCSSLPGNYPFQYPTWMGVDAVHAGERGLGCRSGHAGRQAPSERHIYSHNLKRTVPSPVGAARCCTRQVVPPLRGLERS